MTKVRTFVIKSNELSPEGIFADPLGEGDEFSKEFLKNQSKFTVPGLIEDLGNKIAPSRRADLANRLTRLFEPVSRDNQINSGKELNFLSQAQRILRKERIHAFIENSSDLQAWKDLDEPAVVLFCRMANPSPFGISSEEKRDFSDQVQKKLKVGPFIENFEELAGKWQGFSPIRNTPAVPKFIMDLWSVASDSQRDRLGEFLAGTFKEKTAFLDSFPAFFLAHLFEEFESLNPKLKAYFSGRDFAPILRQRLRTPPSHASKTPGSDVSRLLTAALRQGHEIAVDELKEMLLNEKHPVFSAEKISDFQGPFYYELDSDIGDILLELAAGDPADPSARFPETLDRFRAELRAYLPYFLRQPGAHAAGVLAGCIQLYNPSALFKLIQQLDRLNKPDRFQYFKILASRPKPEPDPLTFQNIADSAISEPHALGGETAACSALTLAVEAGQMEAFNRLSELVESASPATASALQKIQRIAFNDQGWVPTDIYKKCVNYLDGRLNVADVLEFFSRSSLFNYHQSAFSDLSDLLQKLAGPYQRAFNVIQDLAKKDYSMAQNATGTLKILAEQKKYGDHPIQTLTDIVKLSLPAQKKAWEHLCSLADKAWDPGEKGDASLRDPCMKSLVAIAESDTAGMIAFEAADKLHKLYEKTRDSTLKVCLRDLKLGALEKLLSAKSAGTFRTGEGLPDILAGLRNDDLLDMASKLYMYPVAPDTGIIPPSEIKHVVISVESGEVEVITHSGEKIKVAENWKQIRQKLRHEIDYALRHGKQKSLFLSTNPSHPLNLRLATLSKAGGENSKIYRLLKDLVLLNNFRALPILCERLASDAEAAPYLQELVENNSVSTQDHASIISHAKTAALHAQDSAVAQSARGILVAASRKNRAGSWLALSAVALQNKQARDGTAGALVNPPLRANADERRRALRQFDAAMADQVRSKQALPGKEPALHAYADQLVGMEFPLLYQELSQHTEESESPEGIAEALPNLDHTADEPAHSISYRSSLDPKPEELPFIPQTNALYPLWSTLIADPQAPDKIKKLILSTNLVQEIQTVYPQQNFRGYAPEKLRQDLLQSLFSFTIHPSMAVGAHNAMVALIQKDCPEYYKTKQSPYSELAHEILTWIELNAIHDGSVYYSDLAGTALYKMTQEE